MHQKWILDAHDVESIIDAALAEARARQWTVSVAVVDGAGHPLCMIRDDGAGYQTAGVATRKAETAAMARASTAQVEARVKERLTLLAFGDRLPLQGGLPLLHGGDCVGAIGVSGMASDQDELVAAAGVAAFTRMLEGLAKG